MYCIDNKNYPCSTSLTMKYIGGKWKAVILVYLINKTKRYSELKKDIPTISERTLSLQLKQLEEDKIIKRRVYTSKPPLKVEYSLTSFGKSLIPVLEIISNWGKVTADTNENVTILNK